MGLLFFYVSQNTDIAPLCTYMYIPLSVTALSMKQTYDNLGFFIGQVSTIHVYNEPSTVMVHLLSSLCPDIQGYHCR